MIAHFCYRHREKLVPVANALSKIGLTANKLTWLGLAFSVIAAGLIWKKWLFVGGVIAGFAGLCDALDGMMARNQTTPPVLGALLDSSIDRYADFFLLSGFIALYVRQQFIINVFLALLALIGSFMVSYAQAKDEALSTHTPSGGMKRPTRWVVLVGALLLAGLFRNQIPIFLGLATVGIGANISAIKRLIAIAKASSSIHRAA